MNTILLVAEHRQDALEASTLCTLSAALAIGGAIDLLLIGHRCDAVVRQATMLPGLRRVRVVDAPHYADQTAENMAIAVAQLAGSYSHVLAPASSFGKNLMPRVAALLDVAQISDVVEVIAADTFVRPVYAGNALATVRSSDAVKVLTVRMAAFPPVSPVADVVPVEPAPVGPDLGVTRVVSRELGDSTRPSLATARAVVAGGRGLGSATQFHAVLEPLADCLGAAIGASRAAVDAGFAANEYQVGQTGQVVAPELYLAIGLSGAIQHLTGMKDSRLVVAINQDPEAPIFAAADYGLVGDLHELVPQLTAALRTAAADGKERA